MEMFKGFKVPEDLKTILVDCVNSFNQGTERCLACAAGHKEFDCRGITCRECLLSTSGEAVVSFGDRRANMQAFADYARRHGYPITRPGYTTSQTGYLKFYIAPAYMDLAQCVIHGWVSVHEMRLPDDAGAFTVNTESSTIDLNINLQKLYPTSMAAADLFEYLKELVELVNRAMPATVNLDGEVIWQDSTRDGAFRIYSDGEELHVRQYQPETQEMTIAEIEKALGHKVKVIGEEN